MDERRTPAVGIDLGTSFSCVGVFQSGKVEIIANDQGNRTTPSYVAFSDTGRLIGDGAKSQVTTNAMNTVFDAKRLIGRRFDDENVQTDVVRWPFKVVNDEGKPKVEVLYKGEIKRFTPEEISSMVLVKMKKIAETYLGESVKNAVITVPAFFNTAQREATRDAGTIAGLNVMRIINEPTAAALVYGLEKNITGEKNVLVYDLGGGTFDVSILTIDELSVFEVLSTAGDTHLGGEDFDHIMVNHFIEEFKLKHGKNITGNSRSLRRLKIACERAKRILSSSTETCIELDAFFEGIDFYSKISRATFEKLCNDLFLQTLEPVKRALLDANLETNQIDEVVLVGGSTRIPQIQKMLQDFMGVEVLKRSVNIDEAVAYGAACQAAILVGDRGESLKDVVLVDVAPYSLGIETAGGFMDNVIQRNTRIPAAASQTFTTFYNNQQGVAIKIFEGERAMTRDNNFIGKFELKGILPALCGVPQIEIIFDIDANGIVDVTARDKKTGKSSQITVSKNKLRTNEIDRMKNEARKYQEEDEVERQRVEIRNKMESYLILFQEKVRTAGEKLPLEERNTVSMVCSETFRWLDSNDSNLMELKRKLNEIQKLCLPIFEKLQNRIETGNQKFSSVEII
ncbi:heat shock protein 70 B2-like [Saccostrea echinata]|uniref:heat shock protein 70 B2-like n=1 Tax=Saccostrea echinata TaxID=191078 RepID=UPI002A8317F2|nr:heat shock protein 70 B2-like [Saccostrea echinata]